MVGGIVHGSATSGCGPEEKFSAPNMGRPTVYRNVILVIVMLLLTGMMISLSNSSLGQESVLELVAQEYPACAENATASGFDEVVADLRAGAEDMLRPPQAMQAMEQARTRMATPAEVFMALPPPDVVQEGCHR